MIRKESKCGNLKVMIKNSQQTEWTKHSSGEVNFWAL